MLEEYTKAYATLKQCMVICGWEHLYHWIHLRSPDVYEINYYAVDNKYNDYPLCMIIRGIVFDQIPGLKGVSNG